MPETEATKAITPPPPSAMALPPRVTARWAWRRTMSWCHCQFSSSTSSSALYWAMPTMSTIAVEPAELLVGGVEHGGGAVPVGGVAGPAHPVDLGGDVVGPVLLDVHAEDLRPLLGEGVGGLAADALPGADDHEALALQAQEVGVVRNRRVVGSRHGADHGATLRPWTESARWPMP